MGFKDTQNDADGNAHADRALPAALDWSQNDKIGERQNNRWQQKGAAEATYLEVNTRAVVHGEREHLPPMTPSFDAPS